MSQLFDPASPGRDDPQGGPGPADVATGRAGPGGLRGQPLAARMRPTSFEHFHGH